MTIQQPQLPENWQALWQAAGFEAFTQIQVQSFTPLQEGKSVLGISPTGSGKTLAYALPLLISCVPKEGLQLLILLPSQELAIQVRDVIQPWAKAAGLNIAGMIGGANKKRQIDKLKEKPEVIVGTPGRVLELMKEKKIKAHTLKMIVLDEVDRLLEEGSASLTGQVLKHSPRDIQVAAFSATGQGAEKELSKLVNQTFSVIDVSASDQSRGVIKQRMMTVPLRKRVALLKKLAFVPDFKALVFFNKVSELGDAEEKLLYEGVSCASLASDQTKMARKLAIEGFKQGKVRLLLTTDIAARGLDFEELYYVIQFEVPLTEESHHHRSGRVGRMGKDGEVITFVSDGGQKELEKYLAGEEAQMLYVHASQLWDTPQKGELPAKPAKKTKKRT